jgi:hypothetical protein
MLDPSAVINRQKRMEKRKATILPEGQIIRMQEDAFVTEGQVACGAVFQLKRAISQHDLFEAITPVFLRYSQELKAHVKAADEKWDRMTSKERIEYGKTRKLFPEFGVYAADALPELLVSAPTLVHEVPVSTMEHEYKEPPVHA